MKAAKNEVDPATIEAIVKSQKAENLKAEAALERRLTSARDEAGRLATAIAQIPGVRKVLLFGSVARGRPFAFDSDIDLAIEGGDILEAMAIVEASSFSVDVVDLDRFDLPRRSRLLSEGWVLYEKNA